MKNIKSFTEENSTNIMTSKIVPITSHRSRCRILSFCESPKSLSIAAKFDSAKLITSITADRALKISYLEIGMHKGYVKR